MRLSREEIAALAEGRHDDPFRVLGVHGGKRPLTARALIPGAQTLEAFTLTGQPVGVLARVHDRGLFEGAVDISRRQPLKYRAHGGGSEWWVTDAYGFGPVLGPIDDYLMVEGSHLRLFDKLGAHLIEHEGAHGVHFAVWAPNAARVSVVGDFNDWDASRHVMRRRLDTGVWEIFVPDIGAGRAYKYRVVAADGVVQPLSLIHI